MLKNSKQFRTVECYLFIFLFDLFIYLFILFIYLFIYLFILFIYLFIYLFVIIIIFLITQSLQSNTFITAGLVTNQWSFPLLEKNTRTYYSSLTEMNVFSCLLQSTNFDPIHLFFMLFIYFLFAIQQYT